MSSAHDVTFVDVLVPILRFQKGCAEIDVTLHVLQERKGARDAEKYSCYSQATWT